MLAHLKISVGVSSVGNNADAQIVQAVWLDRMYVDAPLAFCPNLFLLKNTNRCSVPQFITENLKVTETIFGTFNQGA